MEQFLQPRRTRKTTTGFSNLGDVIAAIASKALTKPQRLTVPEAAEEYRYINQPGAYIGEWKNETTPYMVEPAEELTSHNFHGIVYVGPAQCAKTDGLIVNWILYGALVDPIDMIIYCPTYAAARDFSIRRVDRLNRHSKKVGQALVKNKDSDNRTDKQYNNGMMLSMSHPSVTELAGRPVGRVALTDYDRMDDDIEGDGMPYDLADKRTTTFGSFGKALAESSPSKPVIDHRKVLQGHEAPPTKGILSLYNRGDRRRWQWPCPKCKTYFEGRWEHMEWDKLGSNMDSAVTVRMVCPACSYKILPDQRWEMQQRGIWVKEGQRIEYSGKYPRLVGKARNSNIASFWQNGVAASLTTWSKLLKVYLDAMDQYNDSSDETALQKFFNTDLGQPYIPQALANDNTRTPEMLMGQVETWGLRAVPQGVRALIATIDVQQNMWIVQIIGIGEGKPFDLFLVDRFSIKKSKRTDDEDDRLWVKPASYLEDWDLIQEQVLDATYPLDDGSGRRMKVKAAFCDSGGKAGVTTNAYNFWREIKARGYFGRFHLVKGDSVPTAPRTAIRYPDSSRRDSKAGARGDIPVLFFNSNQLKDNLDGRLNVVVSGFGMIHMPDWLISESMTWFFDELTVETRTAKGWENINNKRNEAWDLFYYAIGACLSSILNIEKIDWNNCPLWLSPWDANPLIVSPTTEQANVNNQMTSKFDFGALGKKLAGS